jgi:hypothetical protein
MFAKIKSPVFIDALRLELTAETNSSLKAVLKDEKGSICSSLETTLPRENYEFTWNGLNELPYGVYTLELSQGEDEMRMRLVKRV